MKAALFDSLLDVNEALKRDRRKSILFATSHDDFDSQCGHFIWIFFLNQHA